MIRPLVQCRIDFDDLEAIKSSGMTSTEFLREAIKEKLGQTATAKPPAAQKATQAPRKATKRRSPKPKGKITSITDRIHTAVEPCPHRHASVCEDCEKEGWPKREADQDRGGG